MIRSLLTGIILLSAFSNVLSQDFVFRVMANNGSNSFKAISASSWQPVKRGVSLQSGDIIKIVDKAYLGLIHSSGKTIELIDPGEFQIDDIELNIDTRKKGLGGKYTEYVINTVIDNTAFDEAEEVITRGGEDEIKVVLPAASEVLNPIQLITWSSPVFDGSPTYVISIRGIFDETLLEEEIDGSTYLLDLNHTSLKDETTFVLQITLKENERVRSREYALDRVTQAEALEIVEQRGELQEEKSSALELIILASFYEENDLIVDANSCYLRAIDGSPDISDFIDLYSAFKSRHKLD